jgi:hypothetical protein
MPRIKSLSCACIDYIKNEKVPLFESFLSKTMGNSVTEFKISSKKKFMVTIFNSGLKGILGKVKGLQSKAELENLIFNSGDLQNVLESAVNATSVIFNNCEFWDIDSEFTLTPGLDYNIESLYFLGDVKNPDFWKHISKAICNTGLKDSLKEIVYEDRDLAEDELRKLFIEKAPFISFKNIFFQHFAII